MLEPARTRQLHWSELTGQRWELSEVMFVFHAILQSKKARRGRAFCMTKYQAGSPSYELWQLLAITALHLSHLLPGGFVRSRNRVFLNPCARALLPEGRKEPVTWLRRHPLIDPIFPSPKPPLMGEMGEG
jgi:hypothetical protein